MSDNTILIIAGVVIYLVGLAKLKGDVKFSIFGINIGSTSTQTIDVGNRAPEAASSKKPDWTWRAIALLGLLTALVGMFKG